MRVLILAAVALCSSCPSPVSTVDDAGVVLVGDGQRFSCRQGLIYGDGTQCTDQHGVCARGEVGAEVDAGCLATTCPDVQADTRCTARCTVEGDACDLPHQ